MGSFAITLAIVCLSGWYATCKEIQSESVEIIIPLSILPAHVRSKFLEKEDLQAKTPSKETTVKEQVHSSPVSFAANGDALLDIKISPANTHLSSSSKKNENKDFISTYYVPKELPPSNGYRSRINERNKVKGKQSTVHHIKPHRVSDFQNNEDGYSAEGGRSHNVIIGKLIDHLRLEVETESNERFSDLLEVLIEAKNRLTTGSITVPTLEEGLKTDEILSLEHTFKTVNEEHNIYDVLDVTRNETISNESSIQPNIHDIANITDTNGTEILNQMILGIYNIISSVISSNGTTDQTLHGEEHTSIIIPILNELKKHFPHGIISAGQNFPKPFSGDAIYETLPDTKDKSVVVPDDGDAIYETSSNTKGKSGVVPDDNPFSESFLDGTEGVWHYFERLNSNLRKKNGYERDIPGEKMNEKELFDYIKYVRNKGFLNRNKPSKNETEKIFDWQMESKRENQTQSTKPYEVRSLKCRCGVPRKNRIILGQPTDIKSYPWMVQFIYTINDYFFCGGTVINDQYILTAAHCVYGMDPESVGIRVRHSSSKDPGELVEVEAFIPHRGYKPYKVEYYDIALVKLKEKLTFDDKLLPICLPEFINDVEGYSGIITGWGIYDDTYETSDVLREQTVTIVEKDTCRKDSKYFDVELHKAVICAKETGVDSCQGDSGGPLKIWKDGVFIQVGITSWGFQCALSDFPGVYTKVAEFYEWIRRITKDAGYCSGPETRSDEDDAGLPLQQDPETTTIIEETLSDAPEFQL